MSLRYIYTSQVVRIRQCLSLQAEKGLPPPSVRYSTLQRHLLTTSGTTYVTIIFFKRQSIEFSFTLVLLFKLIKLYNSGKLRIKYLLFLKY